MSLQDNYERTTENARLDDAGHAHRVETLRDELIQQMLERGSCDVEYPKAGGMESLFAYLDEDVAQWVYEEHGDLVVNLLSFMLFLHHANSSDMPSHMKNLRVSRNGLIELMNERMESVCSKLAEKGVGV